MIDSPEYVADMSRLSSAAYDYLTNPERIGSTSDADIAHVALNRLIRDYGPPVSSYPHWHPLVLTFAIYEKWRDEGAYTHPASISTCGSTDGFDHIICLRDAFISTPYGGAETIETLTAFVNEELAPIDIDGSPVARLQVKRIDAPLYTRETETVVIYCDWMGTPYGYYGEIHKPLREKIVSIVSRYEIDRVKARTFPEPWSDVRSLLLGSPYDPEADISPFVDERTRARLRMKWDAM